MGCQQRIAVKSISALQEMIRQKGELIFCSSKTSTVFPFEQLDDQYPELATTSLVELSTIPSKMKILADNQVQVQGGVVWEELDQFVQAHGLELLSYPTERLATVLAGVATSATGERSFAFGPLRQQIISLVYLDHRGEKRSLRADRLLVDHPLFKESRQASDLLQKYQQLGNNYQTFKNGPTPRLEQESDLMVGFEGQLGPVVELTLQCRQKSDSIYLYIATSRWEEMVDSHLDLVRTIHPLRGQIISCELLDSNSCKLLPADQRLAKNSDLIFLELDANGWEEVIEHILYCCPWIVEQQVFEISRQQFFSYRAQIPQLVNERNQRLGMIKKGTDVQVRLEQLGSLLDLYRQGSKLNIPYLLFGHLGDCHLHFNLLTTADQVEHANNYLRTFYSQVGQINGAPFAEHGVGMIKQQFLKSFLTKEHRDLFNYLKQQMDPDNRFFPQGFMQLGKEQTVV
ncbi:MAG: FAD-binding oxidoreductase [Bdellovibrionales bacterium]|jgi:FAD/FMN-containing dehydrogenase|nr:FAD-binding oxidoreductase [Bdellovibrionales bacterium]MBT3527485.1 FAD-binding oxidoreductase [Bdellovibrionales bacterium]MBT7766061.1 FAD-binding oxidoreductase [Bdellovibrionales bacterium]